jgi:hypothetical protein
LIWRLFGVSRVLCRISEIFESTELLMLSPEPLFDLRVVILRRRGNKLLGDEMQ